MAVDIELSSTLAFDLGVFLTVVGGVMLALDQFSTLGQATNREEVNYLPMDYRPPTDLIIDSEKEA
jgi:multicomponent K+:H+ antiporter subunit A